MRPAFSTRTIRNGVGYSTHAECLCRAVLLSVLLLVAMLLSLLRLPAVLLSLPVLCQPALA